MKHFADFAIQESNVVFFPLISGSYPKQWRTFSWLPISTLGVVVTSLSAILTLEFFETLLQSLSNKALY